MPSHRGIHIEAGGRWLRHVLMAFVLLAGTGIDPSWWTVDGLAFYAVVKTGCMSVS